jgi:hypothetical protein
MGVCLARLAWGLCQLYRLSGISAFETMRRPELGAWKVLCGRETAKCAVWSVVVVEVLEAVDER